MIKPVKSTSASSASSTGSASSEAPKGRVAKSVAADHTLEFDFGGGHSLPSKPAAEPIKPVEEKKETPPVFADTKLRIHHTATPYSSSSPKPVEIPVQPAAPTSAMASKPKHTFSPDSIKITDLTGELSESPASTVTPVPAAPAAPAKTPAAAERIPMPLEEKKPEAPKPEPKVEEKTAEVKIESKPSPAPVSTSAPSPTPEPVVKAEVIAKKESIAEPIITPTAPAAVTKPTTPVTPAPAKTTSTSATHTTSTTSIYSTPTRHHAPKETAKETTKEPAKETAPKITTPQHTAASTPTPTASTKPVTPIIDTPTPTTRNSTMALNQPSISDFRKNAERQSKEQHAVGNVLTWIGYGLVAAVIFIAAMAALGGYTLKKMIDSQSVSIQQLDDRYSAQLAKSQEELTQMRTELDKMADQLATATNLMAKQQEQLKRTAASADDSSAILKARTREIADLRARVNRLEGNRSGR